MDPEPLDVAGAVAAITAAAAGYYFAVITQLLLAGRGGSEKDQEMNRGRKTSRYGPR